MRRRKQRGRSMKNTGEAGEVLRGQGGHTWAWERSERSQNPTFVSDLREKVRSNRPANCYSPVLDNFRNPDGTVRCPYGHPLRASCCGCDLTLTARTTYGLGYARGSSSCTSTVRAAYRSIVIQDPFLINQAICYVQRVAYIHYLCLSPGDFSIQSCSSSN